jgi:hypothetical protein
MPDGTRVPAGGAEYLATRRRAPGVVEYFGANSPVAPTPRDRIAVIP